jgi:FHS family L-fucose permease-like MFS transporter
MANFNVSDTTSSQPPAEGGERPNYTSALVTLTSLFFMWGLITSLNDILIPHLKKLFTLSYFEAMLVQFCFFAAYFVMSLPAGSVVSRLGYKRGIMVGLGIAGLGCLLFYPAASLLYYPLFLGALFVLASGITVLQVAANPFVAILGKPETASSRLNLTQAFNSLGTTIGPPLGAYLILSNIESTGAKAEDVQLPYIGLAVMLFLLAVVIAYSKLPVIKQEADTPELDMLDDTKNGAWQYPHVRLAALGIFVYVGAEVSIGSFLVSFFSEPSIAGMTEEQGGYYVFFYWGGAMVGRFLGSAILQKIQAGTLLAFNALLAILMISIAMTTSGSVAMYAILAVGFFNSIMFSNIFTLGIAGVGKYTEQASGILVMAIVGGAIMPLSQGLLADQIGLQSSFIVPIFCYAYLIYFGWKGHKTV